VHYVLTLRSLHRLKLRGRLPKAALVAPFVIGVLSAPVSAQSRSTSPSGAPDWQTAAGGRMSFDVASAKPLEPGKIPRLPYFGLGPDNAKRRGGRFFASFSPDTFIQFAYKLARFETADALANAPKWLRTDEYEIEAKAEGNPTKDQMRLMMQSLLAERFKLAVHFESKELHVLALRQIQTGKLGPKLLPHSQGPPCPEEEALVGPSVDPSNPRRVVFPTPPDPRKGVFPPTCAAGVSASVSDGTWFVGSRNTTMEIAAHTFYSYGSMGSEIDLPVVDQTGLDFVLEYKPLNHITITVRPVPDAPTGVAAPSDEFGGTPFVEALRKQLGLKLVRTKAPVRVLVIDHVERPSGN
jgi:bla regulator protein blaR1